MNPPYFRYLDLNVARARIVLSLLAMLSLYIDPTTAGGLFHLNALALTTLLCHLTYSLAMYIGLSQRVALASPAVSTALDLFFATAVAFLTEGQTSPSYVFFVFTIVAVGVRPILRSTVAVTLCSVALYLLVIALSDGMTSFYMMRAVYLAIAGYLIGFVGQQRAIFEVQARELESRAERHQIARSLHDGYVQALAGVNLRLEASRELLIRNRCADALSELTDLQQDVAREYDEVRTYIRSLAGVDADSTHAVGAVQSDPRCQVSVSFTGAGSMSEHLLQIMLEGLRNARRHARANSVTIRTLQTEQMVLITIDDDGVGFADPAKAPWSIASRVTELGGQMSVNGTRFGHLEIEMPAT
jgi:signal transduction histidine kinase